MASGTDSFVAGICDQAARRMTATGVAGADLRERKHLDPFIKDALAHAVGVRPVSRRFDSPFFSGVGAVDVVSARPKLFMELKWSYQVPGKIFESVWDVIKLAILGPRHGRSDLYIATGASETEWRDGDCADLFDGGRFDPSELWERPLVPKRGPNYGETVGEDLVIGARGHQPAQGPRRVAVELVDSFCVAEGFGLKLIRIEGTTDLRAWPQLAPPKDA